ncbi:Alpha/beta hydrolase fold-1 - like 10 [Theobroma cacao]|nr:Alpha/beta hydrolase fold-1 - like 10 [Theobroma cacao]
MDSSNLGSVPEETLEEQLHQQQQESKPVVSAFASVPDRPPTQGFSQKYSPLDWSGYFDREEDICIPDSNDEQKDQLSFALSASKIKEKARIVAMDLRGHGKSSTENDLDLSIETMCNDVFAVLKALYGDSPPAIVLVGHSMGGSVAVHVAAKKTLRSLAGLVVVDVVEGTAMASLMHMQKILSNRMQHFSSIEKAIEWSVRGGSLRNIDSARVSIPTTLKYDDSKKWITGYEASIRRVPLLVGVRYKPGHYHRYEGLSEKFLSCPVPKLLLLAGTDRLDRALTIGQMQGKFQMVVVRHTGHAIQEDAPDEFAMLILNFISRNRIGPHGVEIPGLCRPARPQS